jgi:hypothetical protein
MWCLRGRGGGGGSVHEGVGGLLPLEPLTSKQFQEFMGEGLVVVGAVEMPPPIVANTMASGALESGMPPLWGQAKEIAKKVAAMHHGLGAHAPTTKKHHKHTHMAIIGKVVEEAPMAVEGGVGHHEREEVVVPTIGAAHVVVGGGAGGGVVVMWEGGAGEARGPCSLLHHRHLPPHSPSPWW